MPRRRRPRRPLPYPYAWVGCVVYALVLFGVAAALSHGLVRLDAFDVGELDAARVQAGEWWRAWTALTLHLDGPHLAANLVAGVWFGYLAAAQMGGGTAWLLTVTGAGVANLIEGLLGPADHHSVGASTAVFAALGAMAAFSWRERFATPQRWARRWGPLIAGVVLLGWTGSAGEGTDVRGPRHRVRRRGAAGGHGGVAARCSGCCGAYRNGPPGWRRSGGSRSPGGVRCAAEVRLQGPATL